MLIDDKNLKFNGFDKITDCNKEYRIKRFHSHKKHFFRVNSINKHRNLVNLYTIGFKHSRLRVQRTLPKFLTVVLFVI